MTNGISVKGAKVCEFIEVKLDLVFQGNGGHLLPEKELQQLTDKERAQILSVIRRDAILQLQVQLKAR